MRRLLNVLKTLANMGAATGDARSGALLVKRIRLVNILSLACASVGLFSLPFDRVTAPPWMVWEDIIAVFLYLLIPFINGSGRHQAARLLFLIIGNAIIAVDTLLLGVPSGISLCFFGLAAFALTIFDLSEKALLLSSLAVPVFEYFFFAVTGTTLGRDQLNADAAHVYSVYSSIVTFFLIGMNIYFLQKANYESEVALQSSRAQAVHSARMAALGEMSSGLAHEINTPLMVLQLNASLLRTLLKDSALNAVRIDQAMEKMDRMIARVTKVTHSLQTFSRNGEFDPAVSTSVRFIVLEALELCKEKFKHSGVELRTESIPENLAVECRAVQISQVLLNLLNNAFSAVSKAEAKWVLIDASVEGSFVDISVTDSGPGIPGRVQNRIFEPFFTTKGPGEGTGLGLSISKGILEDHGGELYLDTDSANTRFVVRLAKGIEPDRKQ